MTEDRHDKILLPFVQETTPKGRLRKRAPDCPLGRKSCVTYPTYWCEWFGYTYTDIVNEKLTSHIACTYLQEDE